MAGKTNKELQTENTNLKQELDIWKLTLKNFLKNLKPYKQM